MVSNQRGKNGYTFEQMSIYSWFDYEHDVRITAQYVCVDEICMAVIPEVRDQADQSHSSI